MEIYFDNSATTKVFDEIVLELPNWFKNQFANPLSIHKLGLDANLKLEEARQHLANLFNCHKNEIYFTNSGSFANNLAIIGRAKFIEANNLPKHAITSAIEHPSVLNTFKYLENLGFKVDYIKPDRRGFVDVSAIESCINSDTSIVSLMWANNEIGTLQPIQELAQLLESKNIFFHCDAVQCPAKIKIDLNETKVSSLAISGHKFHAPKGIGALFLRKNINIMPIIFGGGQESGLNPGTHAMSNILALGMAAQLTAKNLSKNQTHLAQMHKILFDNIINLPNIINIGEENIDKRLIGHLSFASSKLESEVILNKASLKGLYFSSGSTCKAGIKQISYVIRALNIDPKYANGVFRISLSHFNTIEECFEAIAILKKILS